MAGHRILAASSLLLSVGRSWASWAVAPLDRPDEHDHTDAFHAYMQKFGRQYEKGSDQYHERLALFIQRRSEVEAQNSLPGRTWTAGMNALADRTEAELAQLRGWRGGIAPGSGEPAPGALLDLGSGSASFLQQKNRGKPLAKEAMEWTKLPSAKSSNQGACGSCWAVTSAEVLQMHMDIYNPHMHRTFSPQELVSCVPNPHECGGSGGCDGATVELAYHWAMNKGLAKESDTPYEATKTSCKKSTDGVGLLQVAGHGDHVGHGSGNSVDAATVGVHQAPVNSPAAAFGMVAFERLAENGYEELLRAVSERGPVAVSVAARPWSLYDGGVFNGCNKEWVVDHAVALIGYGRDKKHGPFYLIQNSWGPEWGEEGRIRLQRQDSDGIHCGNDTQPLLGTGCKGGPKEVKVCGPCGILYDSVVPHIRTVKH